MALGPSIFYERYKDLGIQELKDKLKKTTEYKKSFRYQIDSWKEQKRGIVDNSLSSNIDQEIIALKQLIKEKKKEL